MLYRFSPADLIEVPNNVEKTGSKYELLVNVSY